MAFSTKLVFPLQAEDCHIAAGFADGVVKLLEATTDLVRCLYSSEDPLAAMIKSLTLFHGKIVFGDNRPNLYTLNWKTSEWNF